MPSYKLTYFNGKGRAEISRLCFAAAEKKFEDVRVEQADWPKRKAEMPQGSMPVLEVDGKVRICQSLAIARYLAREFNLYGKDNLQKALVDQILDTVLDLSGPFFKAAFNPNEDEKKSLMKKFTEEDAPKVLGYLENLVKEGGKKGFAVGDGLTVADFALFSYIEMCNAVDMLAKFPKLQENRKTVSSLPRIKKYIDSRPQTAF